MARFLAVSAERGLELYPEQEEAIFDKCIEVITKLCGKSPRGYVAPWWEFGSKTNELLLKKGIRRPGEKGDLGTDAAITTSTKRAQA